MEYSAINKIIQEGDPKEIFGSLILKDVLLPELLGNDSSDILYFAGKELARKLASNTLLGISQFFKLADWGDLSITKQDPSRQTWELTGDILKTRYEIDNLPDFYLEAGFLAQQIQQQLGKTTEATYQLNGKKSVTFILEISN
jgi:predicted hydrocarbon binding protein